MAYAILLALTHDARTGMLSRFGATVVKVDPVKPTYDALVAVFMGVPSRCGF